MMYYDRELIDQTEARIVGINYNDGLIENVIIKINVANRTQWNYRKLKWKLKDLQKRKRTKHTPYKVDIIGQQVESKSDHIHWTKTREDNSDLQNGFTNTETLSAKIIEVITITAITHYIK